VQVSIGIAQQIADALGVALSKIWREMEKEVAEGKASAASQILIQTQTLVSMEKLLVKSGVSRVFVGHQQKHNTF
jgi:hypothetical protein